MVGLGYGCVDCPRLWDFALVGGELSVDTNRDAGMTILEVCALKKYNHYLIAGCKAQTAGTVAESARPPKVDHLRETTRGPLTCR
jgi:hypothetical protein